MDICLQNTGFFSHDHNVDLTLHKWFKLFNHDHDLVAKKGYCSNNTPHKSPAKERRHDLQNTDVKLLVHVIFIRPFWSFFLLTVLFL